MHGPAFSIFGASTEKKLIRALTKDQVENGFVNRMLLVNIGRGALERIEPKYEWSKFPKPLADALKAAAGEPAPEGPMRLELNGRVLRDFRRIGWGVGAKEIWMKFEKDIRGMPSIEDRELWIRAPEQALRLATIVAVFRGSEVVEVEDWTWAEEVVKHSMHQLVQALLRNSAKTLTKRTWLIGSELSSKRKKERRSSGRTHARCNPQALRTQDKRPSQDRSSHRPLSKMRRYRRARSSRQSRLPNKEMAMAEQARGSSVRTDGSAGNNIGK